MNEAIAGMCITLACVIIAIICCVTDFGFRRSGARKDSDRAKSDCGRAADANRELAEQERRTGETLSEAERDNQRAQELVREQAEDNRRAGENNQRARSLVERAKEILDSYKSVN